jgi:ribulose-5-phosphate 4-epimerase/fuculose-1-phosphate aldolase
MTPNERAAPEHLSVEQACAVMRQAYQLGWISTRDGNVSVAMTDRRGFLVSGSGLIKHALVPTQFVFWSRPTGHRASSRRLVLRASWNCTVVCRHCFNSQHLTVLHLHPTHTVAAMYAGRLTELSAGFPEVTRYTRVGPERTRAARHQRGAGRGLRSGLPARPLARRPTSSGLDRHGVVAVGKTPWEAFEHVERLEHICRIALAAGHQPLAPS